MTIIAGFPIIGHVILGADGEEAGGVEKSAVRKIAFVHDGHQAPKSYACVIGGAGGATFIDLAVQHVRQSL